MATFSPWFSGTPSYATYAGAGLGGLGGGGAPTSVRQIMRDQQPMTSMPLQAPQATPPPRNPAPQQQQQRPNNFQLARQFARVMSDALRKPDPLKAPSSPGYATGMDTSGEVAMANADAAEAAAATIPETESAAGLMGIEYGSAGAGAEIEAANYVAGTGAADASVGTGAGAGVGATSYVAPVAAGVVGGKLGSYFGNWAGEEVGMGGAKERRTGGGMVGGAAAGAGVGAMFGGIGAVPGALVGGAVGGLTQYFNLF